MNVRPLYSNCCSYQRRLHHDPYTTNRKVSIEAQSEQGDALLTVHEVASRLRVDDTTVRRWINGGMLESITLPHAGKRRAYRVKESTLENLFKSSNMSNLR